jgi:thiamine biosynthesis lipoprotein
MVITKPNVEKVLARSLRGVVALLMASYALTATAHSPVRQEPAELSRFTLVEYHMGIDARIVLYAPDQKTAEVAAEAAFKRIAVLEDVMSDYRPTSELMRLCAKPAKTPVKISADLFKVLEESQKISSQTGGAFDVTVGPLIQLWRKARKEGKLPDPALIRAAKKLVGYRKLKLNAKDQTATLAENGMKLDLGGIAKGLAADEALIQLQKNGVKSALIEMGGDIVLGDAPPKTEGWQVIVPNNTSGKPEMTLKNCAISSSGDTEQFVVIGGKRYSHVVDPKTGQGLTRRVQASIIAPNGLTSDPISTALTVLNERGRERLLRNYRTSKVFIKTASD